MDNKKKILIVDDSDLIVMLLQETLENDGYETIRAVNGAEGIEMAYREIPDLIIMDVEMPVMKGYQASRLLKSRRGVQDIPIIMHTSNSEDRDRMWAYSSGADTYIVKDPDNLDILLKNINELIGQSKPDRNLIENDSKEIRQDTILEMLNSLYDQQLYNSTILNLLGEVGRSIGDLSETVEKIIGLINNICDSCIAVIMFPQKKLSNSFIYAGEDTYRSDVDKISPICLQDYIETFPDANPDNINTRMIGVDGRETFGDIRTDNKEISSYIHFPLYGNGGSPVGTIHLGSFINNYFSKHLSENIGIFARGAGIVLENALLFNQVSNMEMKIRNVFSKFVPSDIIDDMVEHQSQSSLLAGEKREVVVLFSDIRSFTTISENNKAEDVVAFLNEYFDIMVAPVTKYGGTVDKFIGDAVLALFGAPKSYEDNTLRAVKAAIEMVESLGKVQCADLRLPPAGLNMGIGIHVGELIVGNIGCKDKFDYTVIGDTVNLASRIEGLSKYYKQHIIVSDSVKKKISGDFYFRELDSVKVKGKSEATTLYTVSIENDADNKQLAGCRRNYSKALEMYKLKNWNTAIEYFSKTLEYWSDDYISGMYLERCRDFQINPPGEDWDGSEILDFK
jgi:adenylate cyclase